MEYAFHYVEDAAETIVRRSRNPLHIAFADFLKDVSVALHDLEWVLSGDYGEGDEIGAIKKVLNRSVFEKTSVTELENAIKQAQDAMEVLKTWRNEEC